MHRRKWDAKTTAIMMIEGLKAKPVAEIGHAHPSSQAPYDPWRDPCLAHAANAVEVPQHPRKAAHLEQEHARLNKLVGALTLE